VKPKAVLAYCREKGIRSVDLRFVDIDGIWRRITLPLSALNETSFEEGFGHSLLLDCSANKQPVHLILVPQSEANYLDPFTNQPTLILIAAVQDSVVREESPLDSRQLAVRAMRYMESASIGDALSIRSCFQFRIEHKNRENSLGGVVENTFLACGPNDKDFPLRCEIADTAVESGLHIDRHFCGSDSSSEMILKPSSLVECCDDIMMLRYLIGQHAWKQNCRVITQNLWMPSQWSISRNGEPILVGTVHRGMSEAGLHAIGGILKHADAIAAIALSNGGEHNAYDWLRMCSNEEMGSVCRVLVASHNPRARAIEFLGAPASSNPYLVYSAVLMAIIDGIQNKTPPTPSLDIRINAADGQANWKIGGNPMSGIDRDGLKNRLDNDRDFLSRGEVFSDDLIDVLCGRLST